MIFAYLRLLRLTSNPLRVDVNVVKIQSKDLNFNCVSLLYYQHFCIQNGNAFAPIRGEISRRHMQPRTHTSERQTHEALISSQSLKRNLLWIIFEYERIPGAFHWLRIRLNNSVCALKIHSNYRLNTAAFSSAFSIPRNRLCLFHTWNLCSRAEQKRGVLLALLVHHPICVNTGATVAVNWCDGKLAARRGETAVSLSHR